MDTLNKSEKIKEVIQTFMKAISRRTSENFSIAVVDNAIKSFEATYDFLKYITIEKTPSSDGMSSTHVDPKMESVQMNDLGEAISNIFTMITKLIITSEDYYRVDTRKIKDDIVSQCGSILNEFEIELKIEVITVGKKGLSKTEKIKINLERAKKDGQREGGENTFLIKKILEALIELIGSETSKKFAVASISIVIEELQEKHDDVLKYFVMDDSRYADGIDAISIMSEIDTIDMNKLSKALKDIIKKIQGNQESSYEKAMFIDKFKRQLGDEYTKEIEKIGVNLHLIGLRFV